nr:hypothetical protein CFP56_02450 [Quercus suber]
MEKERDLAGWGWLLGRIDFQCWVLRKEKVENREERGMAKRGSAFWRKDKVERREYELKDEWHGWRSTMAMLNLKDLKAMVMYESKEPWRWSEGEQKPHLMARFEVDDGGGGG